MLFPRFQRFRRAAPAPRPPKSTARQWADSLLFAVVVASLFRWSAVEAYVIPSESMEPTVLVGEYIAVSKLHYGPITPQTPLQIPLTHQKDPLFGLKSYSDLVQLPTYRFPGFSRIRRNDVVVFHLPHEPQYPADLRTNYIKRCVAVAGDTLELRRGRVFINGRPSPLAAPARTQTTYFLAVPAPNDDVRRALHARGVVDYQRPGGVPAAETDPATGRLGYYISCPAAVAADLRRQPFATALTEFAPAAALFPDVADFGVSGAQSAGAHRWQLGSYGPLPVPKKGQVVALTPANAAIYYKIVSQYEPNENISWRDGMIQQNGRPLTRYTIRQNYYFMMGDNRLNSEDSRFWGFVPEDHVVGKALFIWLSLDPNADLLHRVRWDRLFRAVV
ncbi:signal peptidase I [Hymenobacter caeli]|uniref:Signal peptidase I n=1 Tax=Hymenobacter caeli TaxID=2735894 RepID=A0ABX2FMR4_9BACT|nr:signal peptidase I [Hymenobacter caeli]NRT17811.1 signal peptidase I [Hymenobacter caeli]